MTFHGNSANNGGAIYNDYDSNPGIVNSILYGNKGGEIYNAIGTATVTYSIVQGGYTGTGNVDADPLLGPLQNNGGFTQTLALLVGSPAINAGNDAVCPATDQRGVTRPQGSHCDMGAYEYQESSVPAPPEKPSWKSKILTPTSLFTQSGSTNGSISSLSLLDQNGTDDDPDKFVSFQTPGSYYLGYQSFYLLNDVQPALLSSMLLQLNVKAPAPATQIWTWSIYDWNINQWVSLGNTMGANENEWETYLFNIQIPRRFISPTREIRIQLRSNNASEDFEVDYEALHITYRYVPPSPTPVAPTLPPNRPGVASAPSATPSP